MNYENLIMSAKNIPPAGQKAISEYYSKSELMVAALNMHMVSRDDLYELIGKNNLTMMKNNHDNQILFIHSILRNPNPEVLVDTLLWVFRTYLSHGFSVKYWIVQVNAWKNLLNDHLSEETYRQIIPLYTWIQENIPLIEKLSVTNKEEENHLQQ